MKFSTLWQEVTNDVADDGRSLCCFHQADALNVEPLQVGHQISDQLVGGEVGMQGFCH